jgi:hypothetical protein
MRTKQWISGLNNNQRIRAIVNGVGFITTVKDALSGPFNTQTNAMYSALMSLSCAKQRDNATGIGRRFKVYDHKMHNIEYDIQVDLI